MVNHNKHKEGHRWCTLVERRCYIYARLNAGLIIREQGKREKAKIVKAYNDALAEKEFARKLTGHCVRLRRDTEHAVTAYRKTRTLEAADRLADVLDGIMRQEAFDGQA